jgi:hypothetical protein
MPKAEIHENLYQIHIYNFVHDPDRQKMYIFSPSNSAILMMNILHFRNVYGWHKLRAGSAFHFLPFYQELPSTSSTLSHMVTATTTTTSAPTTMVTKIQPVASKKNILTVDSPTFTIITTKKPTESMTPQLLTQSKMGLLGASWRWLRSYFGYLLGLSASEATPDVYSEETTTLTSKSGRDTIKEKERIDRKVEKKAKSHCVSIPSVYCWTEFVSL